MATVMRSHSLKQLLTCCAEVEYVMCEAGQSSSPQKRLPEDWQMRPDSPVQSASFRRWIRATIQCRIPCRLLAAGIELIDSPGLNEDECLTGLVRDLLNQREPLVLFVYDDPGFGQKVRLLCGRCSVLL